MSHFRNFGIHLALDCAPPACLRIHRSGQNLLLAVTLAFVVAPGCQPEPCAYDRTVPVSPQATPFSDGTSVFSKCAPCPELPKMDGVEASGAATACRIGFDDGDHNRASMDCWYGPGGNTGSSISNGTLTDAPNLFGYCEANCPDLDALHACSLTADSNGVNSFVCLYGRTCG
jgi:hypothetical protein